MMVKPDGVKRGLVGECVKRVEQRGREGECGRRLQSIGLECHGKAEADEYDADIFDGGVGQEALDVVLEDGGEVADRHRQRGQHGEEGREGEARLRQEGQEQALVHGVAEEIVEAERHLLPDARAIQEVGD